MRFRRGRPSTAKRAGAATTSRCDARCLLFIVALSVAASGCSGIGMFRQYEYEEEVYLSLDGSATVYVNSSIPALNALRGTSFDTSPTARVDRDAVRAYFATPATHVTWVRASRRNGRRFAHVRLEVADVRRLGTTAAFGWSSYKFGRDGNLFIYEQTIKAASGKDIGSVGWSGKELVAFRLHLPSKIEYHNRNPADPQTDNYRRGNILVWEQPLADRLRSAPLTLDARMQTQSILYRTLWLFGATFLVVAAGFAAVIWWVMRRGGARAEPPAPPAVRQA